MSANTHPDTVKADCDRVLNVWKANTDFKLKDVTLASFQTDIARLTEVMQEITAKEQELTPLRNERDDLAGQLNEVCTRARSGIRGFFGPNSSQYEQAGGTRAAERKKPTRKAKPAAA